MTIKEIVNTYNAMVLRFFAERSSLIASGAILTDVNPLEFKNLGQSADILVPSPLQVHDFIADGNQINVQTPELTSISIVLDKLKDVSYKIDSSVLNAANRFDLLGKYAEEAAKALVRDVEAAVTLEYANAAQALGDGTTGWSEDLVLDGRQKMNAIEAYEDDRYIITKDDTSMYKAGLISAKDKVIIMENGKARSVKDIPEYAGFNIIQTNAIQTVSGVNQDLVVQKNGIVFVNRPMPVEKDSTIEMSVLELGGITLRTTYWYDANIKAKMMSTDILYTVKTIEPNLVINAQIKA